MRAPLPSAPVLRRLGVSLVASVALVVRGIGFTGAGKEKRQYPAAVEGVTPRPGDLELRQDKISADLAPGYTGVLVLDGVEVPEEDTYRVEALNSLELRPQPGSDFNHIAPGPHRVRLLYWRIGEPPDRARSYTWTFSLH